MVITLRHALGPIPGSIPPRVGRVAGMKAEPQAGVLRRLRIARGHLDGVIRMVEEHAYCPEVMNQLSAIQDWVQGANRLVLRNQLETCVADAVREGPHGGCGR